MKQFIHILVAASIVFSLSCVEAAAPKHKKQQRPAFRHTVVPPACYPIEQPAPVAYLEYTTEDALETQSVPVGYVVQVLNINGYVTVRVVNPNEDK